MITVLSAVLFDGSLHAWYRKVTNFEDKIFSESLDFTGITFDNLLVFSEKLSSLLRLVTLYIIL